MRLTRRTAMKAVMGATAATMTGMLPALASGTGVSQRTLYGFHLTGLDGAPMPMAEYAGKVVLLVNTASRCGFTSQYRGLQELHEIYSRRGLVVLGVPSNDFGRQEPGSAEDIRAFCSGTYGVKFPLAAKARVRGANAIPLYRWLAEELGARNTPRWNFHKYLIGRDGRPVTAFRSRVPPRSRKIVAEIERLLAIG